MRIYKQFLCFVVFFLLISVTAFSFDGKVIGISDGDTIKVLTGNNMLIKIRLAEIDTPEKKQPWGKKAKKALSNQIFQKVVTVKPIAKDRYGRTVAYIYYGQININRKMVRTGHAWVYRKYMNDETLLEDENYARQNRLGLWALPEPQRIPPWEWRKIP